MVNGAGDDSAIHEGILIAWHDDRGYGFIRPTGGGRDSDVFVPAAVLAESGRVMGARLRFAVERTGRGPRAAWCAVIDDDPRLASDVVRVD